MIKHVMDKGVKLKKENYVTVYFTSYYLTYSEDKLCSAQLSVLLLQLLTAGLPACGCALTNDAPR